ncbi:MAG: hypothetical protein IK076_00120 [Bacteroidales bacterium]|nr:hypothetical protein [Bacteroidales bacterium]
MERWRIVHKESDFTVIDNGIFRDSDLSASERGFLCTILSLPESWEFSTKGMCEILPEGISAIQATINRLIKHGYCKKGRIFDPKTGRIEGYEYTFYEVKNGSKCTLNPQTDFPYMESPAMDSPAMENQHQLNTISNKVHIESNTDRKKDISISKERFDFLPSLKSLGVSENHAAEWLRVRRTKRLTNTETAFLRLKAEIEKSGRSADDCIRIAVENSWGGFKAEWMPKPSKKYEYVHDIEAYIQAKRNARENNGTDAQ